MIKNNKLLDMCKKIDERISLIYNNWEHWNDMKKKEQLAWLQHKLRGIIYDVEERE